MSRLEDDLRKALARQEPPADFTARVLARVAAEPARVSLWERVSAWFRIPSLRLATVGALCLALAVGVGFEEQRRSRQQGEEAKEKLMLALKITSSKLQSARTAVHSISEE
jgi:negative regulator of sigma E activity